MPTSKPAFRAITPVFLVSDIAPTMRWYADKLGFTAENVVATVRTALGQ